MATTPRRNIPIIQSAADLDVEDLSRPLAEAIDRAATYDKGSTLPASGMIYGDLFHRTTDKTLWEYDGTSWLQLGRSSDVQTFTANGTWSQPDGAKIVEIVAIGGGGGGGSGRRGTAGTNRSGGGGGGGGEMSLVRYPASVLPSTLSVLVGSGGAAGIPASTDNSSNAGGAGSTSSVSSGTTRYAWADFGKGGAGGFIADGTQQNGGQGGRPILGGVIGAVLQGCGSVGAGGGGGNSDYPMPAGVSASASNPLSGSGGGGAGIGLNSSNLLTSTSATGASAGSGLAAFVPEPPAGWTPGRGGRGAQTAGTAGVNGSLYGGGGGGGGASANGSPSGAGGAGAAGLVVVITHF